MPANHVLRIRTCAQGRTRTCQRENPGQGESGAAVACLVASEYVVLAYVLPGFGAFFDAPAAHPPVARYTLIGTFVTRQGSAVAREPVPGTGRISTSPAFCHGIRVSTAYKESTTWLNAWRSGYTGGRKSWYHRACQQFFQRRLGGGLEGVEMIHYVLASRTWFFIHVPDAVGQ